MTQALQSGQHPDADQLSAFVEHALPPHEQQQMLAHLAVCPDCREIAYLAQSAVVEEAAAHPRPVAAHRPWFSGWNLALPAGLAVAFLVILTVHLRNVGTGKNETQVDKTARLEQSPPLSQTAPPTPQAVPQKPIPAPIQKPPGTDARSTDALAAGSASHAVPMHPSPRQSSLNGSLAGRRGTALPSPNPGAASNAALGEQPRQTIAGAGFLSASPAPAAAVAASAPAAQSAAISNVDAVHRELRSSATQYNSTTVTVQNSLNQAFQAAPPPPPPAPVAINETVTVTDAPAMLETESNASSEVIAGSAIGSLAAPTLRMKKQPSLPSHLPALSTISNARQELAVDTAGSLFRSEDAGVSWQPVPVQWTGRALKLQLTPPPNTHTLAKSSNSVAATATTKPAPTAAAQPTFELTNDTGIVWISTDGQTWKHK
jgi:hypothetical protein